MENNNNKNVQNQTTIEILHTHIISSDIRAHIRFINPLTKKQPVTLIFRPSLSHSITSQQLILAEPPPG